MARTAYCGNLPNISLMTQNLLGTEGWGNYVCLSALVPNGNTPTPFKSLPIPGVRGWGKQMKSALILVKHKMRGEGAGTYLNNEVETDPRARARRHLLFCVNCKDESFVVRWRAFRYLCCCLCLSK